MLLSESPTTTKVTMRDRTVLKFPAVTICNKNFLRKSVVYSNPNYEILGEFVSNLTRGDWDSISLNDETMRVNVSKFTREAAHTLEETILFCEFRFSTYECWKYWKKVITRVGDCFTFNSRESIEEHGLVFNLTRAGMRNSLRLRLNVSQDEYFASMTESAGMRVSTNFSRYVKILNK